MKILRWGLGLLFALFVCAGLWLLWLNLSPSRAQIIQRAARADLELVYQAELEFHNKYGIYTTDLASLGVKPKIVYYKFGFVKPNLNLMTDAIPMNPALSDLDKIKNANGDTPIQYAEETKLDTFKVAELVKFCVECVVEKNSFKVIGAANLDADDRLDVWTLDDKNQLVHVADDLKDE